MAKKQTEKEQSLSDKNDGNYIKENCEYLRIPLERFVEGLCVRSMVSDVGSGKKRAGWRLWECLLQRGKVADEAYENYSDNRDYTEWRMQKEILDFLEVRNAGRMRAALEGYAAQYGLKKVVLGDPASFRDACSTEGNVTKRLRRQFYLAMTGMCQKLAGAGQEELAGIFRAAVCQSVPGIDSKPLQGFVLCAREINFILEYAQCFPPADAQRKCRALKMYLENEQIEEDVRVLNYPKVLLILCQSLQKQRNKEAREYAEIIRLCDLGVELLQKTKKTYYLLELLEAKKTAIEQLGEYNVRKGEGKQEETLEGMLLDTVKWMELFEDLCGRFGVEKRQSPDAYLYYGQEKYDAGDMVRARRRMLGMTQNELCERVGCTLDTVRDLERKKHGTHAYYLQEICRVLGLPPMCSRTELVTTNPKARELEKKIRYAANDRKFQENLGQLEELKGMIDMSDPVNQQWVLRTEGMARHELGLMKDAEYEAVVKQALECTLPMSILEYPDEKECYLTNSEMECIYHYSLLVFPGNVEEAYKRMKVVFRLEREFEEAGMERGHVRTYELYMKYKATLLCEMGQYELAKQCAKKVIRLCLCAGRINILDGALYTWMRSNVKSQEKETEPEKASYDWKKDLECCLALSRFCQNSAEEQFYKEVLEKIRGK